MGLVRDLAKIWEDLIVLARFVKEHNLERFLFFTAAGMILLVVVLSHPVIFIILFILFIAYLILNSKRPETREGKN